MASTTVQMAWLTMLVSRQMNRIASGELSFALQQAVLPATADMPARKVHPLTEETLLQSAADKALQGFDQVEAMERLAVITKWLQGTVEKNAKLDMNTRQIEKAEAEKIRRTVSLPVSIPISPGHDGAMTRESSVVLVGYGPAIKILLDHAANAVLAAVDAQQPEHKFCIVRLADLMDTPPLIEETNRRYVQVGRKDWQGQFAMEKRVNQLMLGVVQPRLAAQPDLLIVDDLGAATSGVVGLGRVGVAPFNCNESNKKCLKWCHLAGASLLAGVPSLNPTGNSVGSREWEDLRNHAVLRPVNVIRGDDVPEGKVRIVVGKDAFVLEVDAVLLDGPSKIIV